VLHPTPATAPRVKAKATDETPGIRRAIVAIDIQAPVKFSAIAGRISAATVTAAV